jgi:hypothetical protein
MAKEKKYSVERRREIWHDETQKCAFFFGLTHLSEKKKIQRMNS